MYAYRMATLRYRSARYPGSACFASSPYLFASCRYRSTLLAAFAASSLIAPQRPTPTHSPLSTLRAESDDPVGALRWRSGVLAAAVWIRCKTGLLAGLCSWSRSRALVAKSLRLLGSEVGAADQEPRRAVAYSPRGVSTGDFQEALAALLGKDAPNLSPAVITRPNGGTVSGRQFLVRLLSVPGNADESAGASFRGGPRTTPRGSAQGVRRRRGGCASLPIDQLACGATQRVERRRHHLEPSGHVDRLQALDPERFKVWRDPIFPNGGPSDYISYLREVGVLK
jgi:hypothetical protein